MDLHILPDKCIIMCSMLKSRSIMSDYIFNRQLGAFVVLFYIFRSVCLQIKSFATAWYD